MLRHARGKTLEAVRAAGARPGKFAVADLQDLPFRDRRFGTTISSRVLMHVPDWRRAIAHLCRVTDRVLIIDFPVRFSCAGLDACLKGRFGVGTDGARRAYRTFQPGEIRRELVRHGFRIEKSDRGFLLPVALHRALGRPWISAALEFPGRLLGLRALFGSPVTLRAARSQD
jgi:SAM-dependent methyltransferase